MDDYRLDEGYRNDLSFLFCCHVVEGRPAWLELVPTHIVHTWQVRTVSRCCCVLPGSKTSLLLSAQLHLHTTSLHCCHFCGAMGHSLFPIVAPLHGHSEPWCTAALRL